MIANMKHKLPATDADDNREDDADEEASDASEEQGEVLLNEGWADAISRILKSNKPKRKKALVLSKAKKLTDPVKKVVTEDYEVATADGRIIKEKTVTEEPPVGNVGPSRKRRRELPNPRVKPDILQKDRERSLQKIATRGVVQLFNVVRSQQKDISKKLEEAGPLEARKEKVLKSIDRRAFLDVLMGEKSSVVDKERPPPAPTQKNEPSWNVLRDDFLLSAKIKDWDKNVESENEVEEEREIESD